MTTTHVHGLMADLLAFRKATRQDADETLADSQRALSDLGADVDHAAMVAGLPGDYHGE